MPSREGWCGWLGCLLVLSWALLAGCHRTAEPSLPEARAGTGALQAGAAKVDITPIAGVPLGGHSLEGGTGYGVWTRLWARSIYLEDAAGEPLVMVVADLWSVPTGLADAVVERVQTRHGLRHIGREQLVLSATHTHHSPANFASSRLYNRAASNHMGFDPELFEFLADRIAAAVAESVGAAAPARLRLHASSVPLLARNRSLAPFAENPEAPLIAAHDAGLPTCPDAYRDSAEDKQIDIDPCHAVDPTLTILRIEDLDGRPRALAAFVAVHATSMVNATDAYNGDLFAVATARAEAELARLRPELGDSVVALFNGAEGDVSPNWSAQGRAAALSLGALLGDAIVETGIDRGARGRVIDGPIESREVHWPLADQAVDGPPQTRTAKRALAGKAILGGAEDGQTRYHARLPEGQRVERARRAGQGPKRPAVPAMLFTLVFPRSMIPQVAPLAIHRVGDLSFVGLPGEFTTVMGMRVRMAVAKHAPADAPRPITIGLAGDYLSYFVTPEEYARQHYEGGSTMWGQYAGSLIAERYDELALTMMVAEDERVHEPPGPARHAPGLQRRFTLEPGARAKRALRELDRRLHEQLAISQPLDRLVRFEFDSAPPSFEGSTWPLVSVEWMRPGCSEPGWSPLLREGTPVDERGSEFVMLPVEVERERWRWQIWWLGEPPGQLAEAQDCGSDPAVLRLHAYGPDGSEHCSVAFPLGEAGIEAGTEMGTEMAAVPCYPHDPPVSDPTRGIGGVP